MATKGVVCSYQEVIDLHTESDHVTCLGIHTPTGDTPRRMFKGFFDQYKKYRYLGCSMKLVPAARLPADPMHVNTEAGDLIISPRDLMNPILFHGCHGDDLGTILNTLYGTDDVMDSLSALDTQVGSAGDNIKTGFYEILERLYYRALTDNTWKKASVSRGFRKDNLHPLVYSLATNRQIMPGSQGVDPLDIQQNDYLTARQRDPSLDIDPVEGETGVFNYSMKNNLSFLTPRLTSLGWMDTRNVLTSLPENFGVNVNTLVEDLQRPLAEMVNYAELPKLFMGCVLLPPAYLQEQYFRLIINHRFAFKNFRGISFTPMVQAAPAYADANDDLFDPAKFTGDDFDSGGSGDTPEPTPTDALLSVTYPSNMPLKFKNSISEVQSTSYILGFGLYDLTSREDLTQIYYTNMQYANWAATFAEFSESVVVPIGHRVCVTITWNDGTDNHVVTSSTNKVVAEGVNVLDLTNASFNRW